MKRNKTWTQLSADIYLCLQFLQDDISLSSKISLIRCYIFPPVELNKDDKRELVIIDFETYNPISNIEEGINDVLYFDNDKNN